MIPCTFIRLLRAFLAPKAVLLKPRGYVHCREEVSTRSNQKRGTAGEVRQHCTLYCMQTILQPYHSFLELEWLRLPQQDDPAACVAAKPNEATLQVGTARAFTARPTRAIRRDSKES